MSGPLVVRRGNPSQRWTIVHVASGLIVLRGYRSRAAVLRELDHVAGLTDWSRSADALLADPAVRSRMLEEQVRVAHGRPIPDPSTPEFDQGRPVAGEMVGGPMVETSMIIDDGGVDHDQRRPASESISPESIEVPRHQRRRRIAPAYRTLPATSPVTLPVTLPPRGDMRVRASHSAE